MTNKINGAQTKICSGYIANGTTGFAHISIGLLLFYRADHNLFAVVPKYNTTHITSVGTLPSTIVLIDEDSSGEILRIYNGAGYTIGLTAIIVNWKEFTNG